jgi:tetratricopeptide (TPR) repeat protein
MRMPPLLITLSCVLLLGPGLAHSHDLPDGLGKVTFPTSCDPKVQPLFDAAVAMLHSYWFPEAYKTFNAVLERDPSCAIAHWGIAVNYLGNSLVAPPPLKDIQAAWAALEKARTIGAKTQRERDWIEAISAYYRDHDKIAVDQRLAAYGKAMERMTQRYPDDFEAWAYHALTLQATARADDKTYANQRKAAEILERLVAQNPQHPGAAHYLVHAYDYPPLAAQGIKIARTYGKLAPAAPHARHMPSHIYSMVGLWEDSIASNISALEIQPNYYHAYDFAVYASLQLAQDIRAKSFIDKAMETYRARGDEAGLNFVFHTALAALPARYMLERADWKGAASLPVSNTKFPAADSLTRFARGLGMARSGDLAGAKRELEAMLQLGGALEKSNNQYWADRTREQMLAVRAWVALAEGDRDQAESSMREAADREDASVKNVAMENRLYPMRELLAEMLLELGRAANALREFEASIQETPNRYRGLWGAARAAKAAGEQQKAAAYYAKVVELTKSSDSSRPEIALAKAHIAQR